MNAELRIRAQESPAVSPVSANAMTAIAQASGA